MRNAGSGTLSIFFNDGTGSFWTSFNPFRGPLTFSVGLGASDVQAIDTTGDGRLDLVVTDKLTGQVSILRNLGGGHFAAPTPYRAGTGLSAIDDSDGSPVVTSLEATAGVAAGPLTPGGPIGLVTINPGSDTLDVLVGLGDGRFGNPVAFPTQGPALAVRMAEFTSNEIEDLAVLTAGVVSIYLGNGQGGFLPPVTYAVPASADGLTVADVTGNGRLDLLVGDAYGDVLLLLGNGDGTFAPYRNADQAVELAVTDLTGNGSKDIIYADQGLDRVVVDYGAGSSAVLADQSSGLLDPGAVALADLNGDGIPDLIVANSGSNNVLIYPGLGNGQFGPAINGGNGYFVGTNPVGITVADLTGSLPDLVVADEGSNQVSILLNQSQKGAPSRSRLDRGSTPAAPGRCRRSLGNFNGGAFPDLLVTNSQSNDVTLLPGVGEGFFNDQDPRVYSVGTDPVTSFVGNFNGQPDLVTVNAGSNDLTVISGFEGSNAVVSTIPSGGVDPTTAFAFSARDGFEDLVVGNSGDGALALFEGGAEGLSLISVEVEPNLPDPTALAFSALTGGEVEFYAATAGRESAELVGAEPVAPGGDGDEPGGGVAILVFRATGGVARDVATAGGDGADADTRGVERGTGAGAGRDGGSGRGRVGGGPGDVRRAGTVLDGTRGSDDGSGGGIGRARRGRCGGTVRAGTVGAVRAGAGRGPGRAGPGRRGRPHGSVRAGGSAGRAGRTRGAGAAWRVGPAVGARSAAGRRAGGRGDPDPGRPHGSDRTGRRSHWGPTRARVRAPESCAGDRRGHRAARAGSGRIGPGRDRSGCSPAGEGWPRAGRPVCRRFAASGRAGQRQEAHQAIGGRRPAGGDYLFAVGLTC